MILSKLENSLILLDFDGTIMETAKFNCECYNLVLNEYNKEISYQDFLQTINDSHLDIFFKEKLETTLNAKTTDHTIKKVNNVSL